MGNPILDLNNSDNWELGYSHTHVAGTLTGAGYVPLMPFDIPIIITSPLLFISAENIDAKPWWYLGARLQQKIQTAISPGEAIGRYAKVPVNRPALFSFPMLANQYSLKCEIPPWFDRMKISIWEYTGVIGDSTDQLIQDNSDLIRIDLLRIEAKVNDL